MSQPLEGSEPMSLNYRAARLIQRLGARPLTRFGTHYAIDATAWLLAIIVAVWLRYDLAYDEIAWRSLLLVAACTIILQYPVGWAFHLYRGRHPYGGFAEVRAFVYTVIVTALLAGIPVILLGSRLNVPRSTILIAVPFAVIFMGAARYIKRLVLERSIRPGSSAEAALVYGAGYLGSAIVRRMVTDQRSTYRPVGIIEDAPARRNVWFDGVRVLGNRGDMARIAAETGATVLVVAIARADAELLTKISDAAVESGLRVMVLPPLSEQLEGKTRLRDLRELSIVDLVGRNPIDADIASVSGYLGGKRILVTGAGGSIGSELCRQLAKHSPAELIMLDRDETGLQEAQLSILGHGLLDTKDVVLADIRDSEALQKIFEERKPQVVFHAAALKHLPMLEQYPDEGWKTNVLGTLNVLEVSRLAGVEAFVNISTDKAANPTSVLGHSKRVAERLTAAAAQETGLTYLSVRFGNVIGSRGSMLPTFASLIEAGGPLTVTHPDATRYFMTIPEACQLVIQAGAIGEPGEVLILDMGEPVRILDIAERMIAMSGKDIPIVFTGLRPGEKLHEELTGTAETGVSRIHPKISHATVKPLSVAQLDREGWHARMRDAADPTHEMPVS